VGYTGEIFYNTSKPDGTMFKLTNVDKLNSFGWSFKTKLTDGIRKVYSEYLK